MIFSCEWFGCPAAATITLDDCDPTGERVLRHSCGHHVGDFIATRGGAWKAKRLDVPELFIPDPVVEDGSYYTLLHLAPGVCVRKKNVLNTRIILCFDKHDALIAVKVLKNATSPSGPDEEDGA